MKLFKYFWYMIFMLVWLSLFNILAATNQKQESDTFSEKNQQILKQINLDKDQADKIRQLLNSYDQQGVKDRSESAAIVQAQIDKAWARRNKLEADIEAQLRGDQKAKFKSIFSLDPQEKELFTIKEGVMLDIVQTNTVEYILMKLQEEYRRMWPQQTGVRGPVRTGGSKMAGRDRSGRMRRYIGSRLKDLESKKAREIKKILTKEQIKRHKEIQKIRKKEINEMLKRMKRNSSPTPLK